MNQSASLPLVASLLESPLPRSEVDWLDAARHDNRQAFATHGLPTTRVEAWKYTSLRALGQRSFAAEDAAALTHAVDASRFALPGVDGPRLVFVNGVFRADLSACDALPSGVSLQPLSQAVRDDAEPLRAALSQQFSEAGDAFSQVNAASASDGMALRVAAGVKVDTPVQLVFIGAAAASDLAWHVRNVIDVGDGAEISVVEQHLTHGETSQLMTQTSDIVVHANARLHHVVVQDAGAATSLIRRTMTRLHEQAEATLHLLELGGALVRHDLRAELIGDNARFHSRGVFMPHGRQHVDTQLAIRHEGLNTVSSSNWRGVASERGRGVFRGAILVAPGADGSDASLSNKNLLLSASAEIDTKPELEIYADEVQAAHGATVGQLDERALFYLCSRGIPRTEAAAILTAAFCRAVLGDVANASLREHLSDLLTAQLPDA